MTGLLPQRLTATSALVGAVALVATGAVLGSEADATHLGSCQVSSVESQPTFARTALRVASPTTSATVKRHHRTSTDAVRTKSGRWRVEVRVSARVKSTAVRAVSVGVPTSVPSTATAVCGANSATATATATATGRSRSKVEAQRVARYAATGKATADTRRAAAKTAQRRALDKTRTSAKAKVRAKVRVQKAVGPRVSAATKDARARGHDAAADTARRTARRDAESRARRSTPRPTAPAATPSPTATVPATGDPTVAPTPTGPASPTSTPTTTATATATPVPGDGKLLIKHGWDIPTPAWMARNKAAVDAVPYDGVVILMPDLSYKVMSQTPITYEQFRAALAPIPALQNVKHNFVIVYRTDLAAQADWSIPVANFANLARAARDKGIEGIAYDGERYFGGSDDWPSACSSTLAGCQALVRGLGQQVMTAVKTEWPTGVVFSLMGPWVSNSQTCRNTAGAPCNDISWANELAGPFVSGLIDVGGSNVVDGGEAYTLRTPAHFAAFHAWQKKLHPTVSAATGVYDYPWIGASMDSTIWTTTLRNALASSDKYAWAYTEKHDWWGTGWPYTRVPAEWLDATRLARTP